MTRARGWMCALLVALAPLGAAAARDETGEANPEQLALVERYIEAVRAKDPARLRGLYHDSAFACVSETNRPAADVNLASQLAMEIPPEYEVYVYPTDDGGTPQWMRGLYDSAVPASHQFQIQFTVGGNYTIVNQPIARQGNDWALVLLCLTDKGVAWYEIARKDPKKARAWLKTQD